MKSFLIMASALALGSAALGMAQNAPATSTQAIGRGNGGAPYAWNDKNKDGICDVTGLPVGQGRGAGARQCGRRGRGAVAGRAAGAGWGRGMGRGFRAQQQAAPTPAQK
jgi:hypothetical protein